MYDMILYRDHPRVTTDQHTKMNNIFYSNKNLSSANKSSILGTIF